ncbi:hypothetical protein K523DRAFT_257110 [Schizophyllum commune Tattone D]|nr:hypothetical protein K523DRAFT_257110 [Schizophyllum commune Tattone D]
MPRHSDARRGRNYRRLFADPEPPGACAGSLGEGSDEGREPSLPFLCHKRRNPTLRDRFERDRTAGGARALNDSCEEGGILSDLSKDRGTRAGASLEVGCDEGGGPLHPPSPFAFFLSDSRRVRWTGGERGPPR